MIRTSLNKLTAAPTRAGVASFGTAIALAITAMAAASPVVTSGEEPAAAQQAASSRATVAASRVGHATAGAADVTLAKRHKSARQPKVSLATEREGHFGGRDLAVALAVSGRDVSSGATAADVVAVAESLGVAVSDPITVPEAEAVRAAAWKAGVHQFTLAAIGPGDAPDPSDIREAGERLGVKIGKTLEPGDVTAVLAAGRKDVARAMAQAGFKFGKEVGLGELQRAAKKLGLKYGKAFEPKDAKGAVYLARDKVKRAREARKHTPAFAKAAGVVLRLPSHRVEYAGFHQAAFPGVITMNRAGKADTRVLPSRGRGTSRASAIDIVQAPGEDVRAPVTGKVVEVTNYALYGKYKDTRIRIRPRANRNTIVSVLHVEGAKVRVGSKVRGGMTVIAGGPRKFPFRSQVDGFAGRNWGHVHVEIRGR